MVTSLVEPEQVPSHNSVVAGSFSPKRGEYQPSTGSISPRVKPTRAFGRQCQTGGGIAAVRGWPFEVYRRARHYRPHVGAKVESQPEGMPPSVLTSSVTSMRRSRRNRRTVRICVAGGSRV